MPGDVEPETATGALRPVHVPVGSFPPSRLEAVLDPAARHRLRGHLGRLAALLRGRVLWNVNSTAAGGGVAEMLRSFLPYLRGSGIDARWAAMRGTPEFFAATKRLHHLVHGEPGDGGSLGDPERIVYDAVSRANATGLLEAIRAGDVVLLHDPQTAGMIGRLRAAGAVVVWRSHVGTAQRNAHVGDAWRFLLPHVEQADAVVFSRPDFAPDALTVPSAVIRPSIDPEGPKNADVSPAVAHAILDHVGLARADPPVGSASPPPAAFVRQDGSPARVEHGAEVLRTGPPPRLGELPLVVQVSRWDRLKDPVGVLRGFVDHVLPRTPAHLVLAGPTVHSVADDPEAAAMLLDVMAVWKALPHAARRRVQLACLPMADLDENAAIVNALQRTADVVVQKSLREGFGLTATEAMWKARPVVASDVGGLGEQIQDGRSGLLLRDPGDLAAFGALVGGLLRDPQRARGIGEAARERVRARYLHDRQIADHAALLERVLGQGERPADP